MRVKTLKSTTKKEEFAMVKTKITKLTNGHQVEVYRRLEQAPRRPPATKLQHQQSCSNS